MKRWISVYGFATQSTLSSWARQFAYYVISYCFVGTSHRGSK